MLSAYSLLMELYGWSSVDCDLTQPSLPQGHSEVDHGRGSQANELATCTLTPADTWSLNKVTVGIHQGFLLTHRTGQPYAVTGIAQAVLQISPVWVCPCQGRTSSFHQARCQSVCCCSWSHSLREETPVHMWPSAGKCLCIGNIFNKFCTCVWARLRHVCLWQAAYTLSDVAVSSAF